MIHIGSLLKPRAVNSRATKSGEQLCILLNMLKGIAWPGMHYPNRQEEKITNEK